MELAAYAIIAFGFVFLGYRLFLKVREIASWKPDDESDPDRSSASGPRDLLTLTIEQPTDDLDHLGGDEHAADGAKGSPERPQG